MLKIIIFTPLNYIFIKPSAHILAAYAKFLLFKNIIFAYIEKQGAISQDIFTKRNKYFGYKKHS